MNLYTVYRASRPELGEAPDTWFPTLTTHYQRNMLKEQMYLLKRGIEVKVVMEKVKGI